MEACEFKSESLESTLGRETLCFSGNVAPGVAKVGSLFGAGLASDLDKLSTKSAQNYSDSTVCTSKSHDIEQHGAWLEDEVGEMCKRL